jgi:hypothetical protein
MAPEQAQGNVHALDARTDVFGLGAMLCEILTGTPPFVANHAQDALKQAAKGDLEDAYARLADCKADKDLVDIARRCLEPSQYKRPENGSVVAEQVLAYQTSLERRLHSAEAEAKAANAERKKALAEAEAANAEAKAAEARATLAEVKIKYERKLRRRTQLLAATLFVLAAATAVVAVWQIEQEKKLVAAQQAQQEEEKKRRTAEQDNREAQRRAGALLAGQRTLEEDWAEKYSRKAQEWADIFRLHPNVAEDLTNGFRFRAACTAVLAAAGTGREPAQLDAEKAKRQEELRDQANQWLRQDLALFDEHRHGGQVERILLVIQKISQWEGDTALATVRADAVDKLPEKERAAWRSLWREETQLIAKIRKDTQWKVINRKLTENDREQVHKLSVDRETTYLIEMRSDEQSCLELQDEKGNLLAKCNDAREAQLTHTSQSARTLRIVIRSNLVIRTGDYTLAIHTIAAKPK